VVHAGQKSGGVFVFESNKEEEKSEVVHVRQIRLVSEGLHVWQIRGGACVCVCVCVCVCLKGCTRGRYVAVANASGHDGVCPNLFFFFVTLKPQTLSPKP